MASNRSIEFDLNLENKAKLEFQDKISPKVSKGEDWDWIYGEQYEFLDEINSAKYFYTKSIIKNSSVIWPYLSLARFFNGDKDYETAHQNLNKTGKILLELLSTLREDKGGEIAANLKKIYVHCYEQIVIANLKKDIQMIKDVQTVLGNLSEGWKQMAKKETTPLMNSAPQQIRITG